mmetsp:Transcript_45621/g.145580  ORF Transcript_45621/g.145580 Transcript_45621/m.145580 type:complete len:224 (+) Transcript_45621:266-937(+)
MPVAGLAWARAVASPTANAIAILPLLLLLSLVRGVLGPLGHNVQRDAQGDGCQPSASNASTAPARPHSACEGVLLPLHVATSASPGGTEEATNFCKQQQASAMVCSQGGAWKAVHHWQHGLWRPALGAHAGALSAPPLHEVPECPAAPTAHCTTPRPRRLPWLCISACEASGRESTGAVGHRQEAAARCARGKRARALRGILCGGGLAEDRERLRGPELLVPR